MDKFKRFLPLILFVVAFGYRLIGIGWGLPSASHHQTYHPDEEVIWNYSQAIEPGRLDFTPGFYNYGTLYLTTLRVVTDMVGVYGGHMPQVEGEPPSSPTLTDWEFVGRSHLAGRIVSTIFGSLIPVFVFLILRKRTNLLGSSLGALTTVFAPGLVVHSRFQTVDVMAASLLAISAWLALRFLEDEELTSRTAMKLAVWSGVFAGLSAGTKYTGFLAVATLVVALWFSKRPDWAKLAGVGFASALIAFFAATPGALLESSKFIEGVKYEMAHTAEGHGLVFEGLPTGFWMHISNLIQTFGLFALILGAIGIVYLLAIKKPAGETDEPAPSRGWMWALLAFALPYYILIGRAEVVFLRYTFPLVIVCAAGFGWLVGWAHERKGKWMAVPVVGILALGQALAVGARMTSWMVSPDPRDQAAAAIKAEAQPQSIAGLVSDPWFYTPSLFPDSALSRMPVVDRGNPTLGSIYQFRKMMETEKPKVVRYLPPNASERFDWDVRLLTETKPDYVVYSSFEFEDPNRLLGRTDLREIPKLLVDRFKQFGEELEKGYTLSSVYGDPRGARMMHDLMYIQPTIYVWKRKP